MDRTNYWAGQRSRRAFLRAGAAAAASAAVLGLVGCRKEEQAAQQTEATTTAATVSKLDQYDARRWKETLPGWKAGQTPQYGGTLRFSFSTPTNWDLLSSAAGTLPSWVPRHMNGLMINGRGDLAGASHQYVLDGDLTRQWEQPDPTTYVFRLHPGVKWQQVPPVNGRDFKAEDVKYALDNYRKAPVQGPVLEEIERIEVQEPDTVKITLKQPSAYFLVSLAAPYNMIFSREQQEGPDGLKQAPIGTGPFILTEQTPRVGFKGVKNPTYFKTDKFFPQNRLPYLDGFQATFFPDVAAAMSAFRTDQIDYYSLASDTWKVTEDLLRTNPDVVLQVNPPAPNDSHYLAFRTDKAPWNDPRVRQAISMAIDRQTIIDSVYYDLAAPTSLFNWTWWGRDWPWTVSDLVNDGAQYYAYNPAESKKLLEAAGASNLRFKVVSSRTTGGHWLDLLALIQADLRKVGVEMEMDNVETAEFSDRWFNRKFDDAVEYSFITQGADMDNFTYELMYSKSPKNLYWINDPKVDDLALKQRRTLDVNERTAIIKELAAMQWDQQYRVGTVTFYKMNARHPQIYNVVDSLTQWFSGWNSGCIEMAWRQQG